MGGICCEAYIVSPRGSEPDIRHNSDYHVFLDIKLAGVKTPCVTEGGELSCGEGRLQQFPSRKSKQLCNIG